jgi:hypothetical protein
MSRGSSYNKEEEEEEEAFRSAFYQSVARVYKLCQSKINSPISYKS